MARAEGRWWNLPACLWAALRWPCSVLAAAFNRPPYTRGMTWNNEWMDSYDPERDDWILADESLHDDLLEPDEPNLAGARGPAARERSEHRGTSIRAPPAENDPALTRDAADRAR